MRYRTSKMAQELAKHGDKVTIFAASAIHNTNVNLINDNQPFIVERYNDIDYVFVRVSSYETNGADRVKSLFEFYFRLKRVIGHFKNPDCIVAESPYPTVARSGILAARAYGVPCVVEIRDLWPQSIIAYQGFSKRNPLVIALYRLEKWIYQNADALVFTIPGGWDYICDQGWGRDVDRAKVFHINNGVDIERFDNEKNEEVYSCRELDDPDVFKIVYCGSVRKVNNLKTIVDAAALLQNECARKFHIIIFGDGDQKQFLENFCTENGIENVTFEGFVEKKYIPSIVTRSDANLISVAASPLGRYGYSWNKAFEYLAAEKPIISNFETAYDLIKEHDCGRVSKKQDARSIADTIYEVANLSTYETQAMSIRARALAHEYDFKTLARRLRDIIEGLLGSSEPIKLVSLCTIAYNEGAVINKLFEDFEAQDYPHENIEIVLVDGGSTDDTKEQMEKFASRARSFFRVVVLDNPRRIQPSGWNVAIAGSEGDAIIRVDAHASIPANFVRKSVRTLENGEDVCGGVRPVTLHKSTPWGETLLLAERSIFGSSAAAYRRDLRPQYVSSVFHGTYRREVFDKVGLFDERLVRTEDNELHHRIRTAGYGIRFNPAIRSTQYARSTLVAVIRQKATNGYWVGRTVFIAPKCLSLFHFAPVVFVLGLLSFFLLGLIATWIPEIILCTLYLVVNVVISIKSFVFSDRKTPFMVALPFVFFAMHIAYGVGTLFGLVAGVFRKKEVFDVHDVTSSS